MKKYIIILFLLQFTLSSFGQMPVSDIDKKTHFDQLKNGVLFIQLPDIENAKILRLNELGRYKAAEKEEKEILKLREYIIKGFNEKFDFCDFYFFNTKDVKQILKGEYQGLFDNSMSPIKDFKAPAHIYIVRYGPGNPNGEVYRYNGDGFQIRYVDDGILKTIKYDNFFAGPYTLFYTLSTLKRDIFRSIKKLNKKLQREIF